MEKLDFAISILALLVYVPLRKANNITTNVNRTKLYIGAFFDLQTRDGRGALPMANQAIEEINNNTDILPGYRLELVVNSTYGSLARGQKVFQEFLTRGPRKIMLLGPVENTLAKSIAAYSGLPGIRLLQFSYGTSALELANKRDLYPYFFRTVTSLASLDLPRIQFIKEFGWHEVGIIYGDSAYYMMLSNQLADRLKRQNINVLAEVRLQENDPHRAIRTMKDKGIHVILGMFKTNQASSRKMFCEAYRQKMYGPHYVWILWNSFNNNWWIPRKGEDSACSDVEMKCQIQNHFSFYHSIVTNVGGRFYKHVGKNRTQIISDYRAQVDNHNDTSNRSAYFMNVYDAVWSIAFVLNNSREELERDGKKLENLTYGDKNASELFRRNAIALEFPTPNIGQTVRYYSNGNRKSPIFINEIILKEGKFKTVSAGTYDIGTETFMPSSQINWFAGTPYEKTTESYIYRTIDRTLFYVLVSCASLGIAYALFCLLMLIVHFKIRIIQNSAPVVNVLIILGCVLNYVTVILYGFDYSLVSPDTVTRLCRARTWTFAIGFTSSVGGLAAKLWMAHAVLKDRFVRSKNVMMFWMLGTVFLLIIIDVLILGCWEGMDALNRVLKQVRSQPEYKCFEPITADTFRAKIEVVEHCDCASLTLWLAVVLLFKALVLLVGGFLAWQTRRLYIPSLNDTQQCVTCMFVVLLFCIIGIIVALTMSMYPTVYYGVIGPLIIIATTIILVSLFIKKIARLGCKPRRNKIIVGGSTSGESSSCGAGCSKFCRCCACSPACCITFFSCFPCCNPYLALRKFCFGNRVRSADTAHRNKRAEFYVGGIPQDRDAEIIYLRNEIREKDSQLSKFGACNRTVKTHATQTEDNGNEIWSNCDDEIMKNKSESGNDVESRDDGKHHFRAAANRVKIFNKGLDYSHIKSKVNTGIKKTTMAPSPLQPRKESRPIPSPVSNEQLSKLKSTLAQKEQEILQLRKELYGQKPRSESTAAPRVFTSEQNHLDVSPETTATFVPSGDCDITHQTSSAEGLGIINERGQKMSNHDETNRKSSLGAAGAWLFSSSSKTLTDGDESDGHGFYKGKEKTFGKESGKNSTQSPKTKQHDRKTGGKSSLGTAGIGIGLIGQPEYNSLDKSTLEPNGSQRVSPTNVVISLKQSVPSKIKGKELSFKTENGNGSERNAYNVGFQVMNVDVKNKDELKKGQDPQEDDKHLKQIKNTERKNALSWLFGNKDTQDAKLHEMPESARQLPKEELGNRNEDESVTETSPTKDSAKQDSILLNNPSVDEPNIRVSADPAKLIRIEDPVNRQEDKKNDLQTKDKMEMIDEGEENELDDDEEIEEYDEEGEEEQDDDSEESENKNNTEPEGGIRPRKRKATRRRRKTLPYGKLNWKAQSKIDTGGGYKPKRSRKNIANFKTDYSHIKSRLSTISDSNISGQSRTEGSTERKRTVAVRKTSLPDYSKVRPRLYNGVKKGSEISNRGSSLNE